MILYRTLLTIDTIAALIVIYFFFIGLADGSVSSFNIGLWLALLGGLTAIIGGGLVLKKTGRRTAACLVLAILGVPAFLFGLFVLGMIVFQPRWQ